MDFRDIMANSLTLPAIAIIIIFMIFTIGSSIITTMETTNTQPITDVISTIAGIPKTLSNSIKTMNSVYKFQNEIRSNNTINTIPSNHTINLNSAYVSNVSLSVYHTFPLYTSVKCYVNTNYIGDLTNATINTFTVDSSFIVANGSNRVICQ